MDACQFRPWGAARPCWRCVSFDGLTAGVGRAVRPAQLLQGQVEPG
ncbi:MAG: hypothetical protein ABIX12_02285 [Rubrivivax sp.]